MSQSNQRDRKTAKHFKPGAKSEKPATGGASTFKRLKPNPTACGFMSAIPYAGEVLFRTVQDKARNEDIQIAWLESNAEPDENIKWTRLLEARAASGPNAAIPQGVLKTLYTSYSGQLLPWGRVERFRLGCDVNEADGSRVVVDLENESVSYISVGEDGSDVRLSVGGACEFVKGVQTFIGQIVAIDQDSAGNFTMQVKKYWRNCDLEREYDHSPFWPMQDCVVFESFHRPIKLSTQSVLRRVVLNEVPNFNFSSAAYAFHET